MPYVDLNFYPMGDAINFKINWLNTKDWDNVRTDKLSIELKEGGEEQAKNWVTDMGVKLFEKKRNNIFKL